MQNRADRPWKVRVKKKLLDLVGSLMTLSDFRRKVVWEVWFL